MTEDVYQLPDGSFVQVPAGSTPPAGGTLVGGPSLGNSPSSPATSTPLASGVTSGTPSSIFDQAAGSASGTSFRNIEIPVWRDPAHMTGTYSSGMDDRQGAEQQQRNAKNPPDDRQSAEQQLRATKGESVPTPQMFKEKDAYNQFSEILTDPDKFKQWSQVAVQSGLLNPAQSMDAASLQKVWNDMVKFAVDIKQAKGIDMTPMEAAQMIGQNSGAAFLAHQNFVRDHLTGTRVQNDQTIDDKTPSQSTLHDLLGRNPTQAELIAYNHGVEQTAQAHPLNRQISTHYVEGQPDSQVVTYTGGYDQQAAEQQAAAAASPEVAANQSATTYYNALRTAIQAAV